VKFGIFLPNGSNGYILSRTAPRYDPSFAHNLAIAQEAERQGLDYVLSMMKFRGFGGDTGYWDACLESFTLTAGLAAATTRIELFPSIALQSIHPAVVARMVATLDDISGGRCGLNIVTGWNKPEYSQMGLWRGDDYYDQRYEYAAEYVSVLKALWRDGRADFHGRYFDLEDCRCLPRPRGEIRIVCAGQSPRGVEFAARYGDWNFVMATVDGLGEIARGIGAAAARHGRRAGTLALYTLLAADTDAAAQELAEHLVAGADHAAIRNVIASAALDSNPAGTSAALQAGLDRPLAEGNMVFMGFPVIVGSWASVAREIDDIAARGGVDGILFNMPDFVPDIRNFGERVMPLLACRRAR
jgi:pyrimidine oxygenase